MNPKQPCCDAWAKAHEIGTDNEGWGRLAWDLHGEMHLGLETPPVRFCPWCAAPKGERKPKLAS